MFKVDNRNQKLEIHKSVQIDTTLINRTRGVENDTKIDVYDDELHIRWNGSCCSKIKFERDNWFGRTDPKMRGKSLERERKEWELGHSLPEPEKTQRELRREKRRKELATRGRGGQRRREDVYWVKKSEDNGGEDDEDEDDGYGRGGRRQRPRRAPINRDNEWVRKND